MRFFRYIPLLIREMRPHQWIKNVFVFAPALFAKELFNPDILVSSFLAAVAFSLISSAVYIINDFFDREKDRYHPKKRTRPIASGELHPYLALAFALLLALAVLIRVFFWNRGVFAVLLVYLLLNLFYSVYFKKIPLLDIFLVAIGFDLREAAGGFACSLYMSPWMFVVTFLLALFIAATKRRQEIANLGEEAVIHREALSDYNLTFLDNLITIITASTLISYIIYTLSKDIKEKFVSQHLYLTTPFVLYGILRYLYLVYVKGKGDDPMEIILRDLPFQVNLALWAMAVFVILYFGW